MRRNSFLTFLKEKSFIIVLTLMLVSAGTMAALFSFGGREVPEENLTAQKEESVQELPPVKEPVKQEPDKETAVPKKTTDTKDRKEVPVKPQAALEEEDTLLQAELEDQYLEEGQMAEVSGQDVMAEGFSEGTLLSLEWPVEGEIILDFSMDQSIYFPTLAQYQYNPAMIIAAAEGTEVFAAASGTVIDLGKSSEYGHYVTMDLGDGFELTYGQLFDITTEVGETLEMGDRIAMVAYPTGNYVEEGDNLYLKLTRDGVAVDPALYLKN